jgi:hypothetical protein
MYRLAFLAIPLRVLFSQEVADSSPSSIESVLKNCYKIKIGII